MLVEESRCLLSFIRFLKIYTQCIQCKVSDRKNIIFDDEFPFRRRNGDSRRINRRVGWWEHRENLSIRAVILACVFSSRLPPLQMRSIPLERSFVTMRLHGTPHEPFHIPDQRTGSLVFSNFCQTRCISMVLLPVSRD